MTTSAEHWLTASPADRARAAAGAVGPERFAAWCADVLTGAVGLADLVDSADPDPRWLAATAWTSWGSPATWPERGMAYWPRVWAARSLLHAWSPEIEPAVVTGLDDDHWRVREMCAKVVARHELATAANACAALVGGDAVARVRVAALRALAAAGEAEHAPVVLAAQTDPDPSVAVAAERARAGLEGRLDRSFEDLVEP